MESLDKWINDVEFPYCCESICAFANLKAITEIVADDYFFVNFRRK